MTSVFISDELSVKNKLDRIRKRVDALDGVSLEDFAFDVTSSTISLIEAMKMFHKFKEERGEQEKKSKEEKAIEIEKDDELKTEIRAVIDNFLCSLRHIQGFRESAVCPSCLDGVEAVRIEAIESIFNLLKKDQENE